MSMDEKKTKVLQPCRYCGGKCTPAEGDICRYCRDKLPVVRKLIAVGEVIRICAEEERKLREEIIIERKQQYEHQKI